MFLVFGESGTRLMCWPHVYRNMIPQLSQVKKEQEEVYTAIVSDVEELQWSACNEATFRLVYDLMEKKYFEMNYDDDLKKAVEDFYFRKQ